MGETSSVENVQKKSKVKALRSEFKKIMWPDTKSVARKAVAVIVATAVLAFLIAMVDEVFKVIVPSLH